MQEEKVKLNIKSSPLHQNHPDVFLPYNLYIWDGKEGTEKSIPLKYPCVREGCSTTCYFEGKKANDSIIHESCHYCGNTNPKIYLDIGYKQFILQNINYITSKTPLSVQINPATKAFRFTSTNIKNNLLSKMSYHIGSSLFRQLAFDEIPAAYKKQLDFWALKKALDPIFAPKYHKRNSHLYSFCKYHPQPQEATDKNQLLLFFYKKKQPLKVLLVDEEQKGFCPNKIFLEHCLIGFLSASNTFVMGLPSKEGMKYYVSCLDLHFNEVEGMLLCQEQPKWKEEVSRFGGSLIVDQENGSCYMIGGFDPQKNQIPDHLVTFEECRWIHKDDKYQLHASIKRYYPQSTPTYNKKQILIQHCSFSLQNLLKFHTEKINKCLFSVGGTVKDFDFFSSGYQTSRKSNMRYFNLDFDPDNECIIYQKKGRNIGFPHRNYIIFEIPEVEGISSTKINSRFLLIFGGSASEDQIKQRDEDSHLTHIYLVDKEQPEENKQLQAKFEYGHLLSSNLDNFTSLLFDQTTNSFYVRGTYPVKTPFKTENGSFVHYIMVEFDIRTGHFRAIPGTIEQI